MKNRSTNALLTVALGLALAALACNGGAAAPTAAPSPAVQASQAIVPTNTPAGAATSAATKAATEATTQAATEAATAAATSAPTTAPTAAALSGNLDIHGITTYQDNLQYFRVDGLLTNGTDKTVDNIELALTLADKDGKTVLQDNSGNPTSTVTFEPILGTLASGETTPFEYFLSADQLDTSGWKADVKLDSNETFDDLQRTQVVVENDLMTVGSDGDVYLTGEVVNKSDQPAVLNNFAGALLDGSGNVNGTSSFQDVTRLLSPAGDAAGADRSPFVIHIPGPVKSGGTPTYYFDAVQGKQDDLDVAANIDLHLDTSYADENSDVYVVATVTNSGTETMTVRVMSGLYNKDGKVLDGSSANAPIQLAPGASSPVPMYYFANLNGNADLVGQVTSYTAQIDPYWTFVVTSDFVPLAATDITTTVDGSSLNIQGNVTNDSGKTLNSADVVIIVHDASGKTVAADWAVAEPDSGDFTDKTTQPWHTTLYLPPSLDPTSVKVDTIVQGNVKAE
jgi:hypothetical protein